MEPPDIFDLFVEIGDIEEFDVEFCDDVCADDLIAQYKDGERAYYAAIFEFIVDNQHALRLTLRRWCRKQTHLLDELWSDVVLDMIPRAFRTFDPAKLPDGMDVGLGLRRHVFHTVKWYVVKWMNAGLKRRDQFTTLDYFADNPSTEFDAKIFGTAADHDTVQKIMAGLSEYERLLLQMHYGLDYSITDIAKIIGISREYASKQVAAALLAAQKVAARLQY